MNHRWLKHLAVYYLDEEHVLIFHWKQKTETHLQCNNLRNGNGHLLIKILD